MDGSQSVVMAISHGAHYTWGGGGEGKRTVHTAITNSQTITVDCVVYYNIDTVITHNYTAIQRSVLYVRLYTCWY